MATETGVSTAVDHAQEPSPATLGSLVAYYSSPKLSAKSFVKQLGAMNRHLFDVEDRHAAAALIHQADPEFRRTLDLVVQALGARTRMTRDLVMGWAAEVVRSEWAVRAPSVNVLDGASLETLRQLAQIVRKPPGRADRRIDSSAEETKAGEKRERDFAQRERKSSLQLLKLTFLWMNQTRRLSIVEARGILMSAMSRARRQAVVDDGFVLRLIAPAKPDRLTALLEFAGLWEQAVDSASESERVARRGETEARDRLRSLQTVLEEAGQETAALKFRIEGLEKDLDKLRIALLAHKQSAATASKEMAGRILRLLDGDLATRLEIANEALETDPPVIEVALKNLETARRDIGKASEWLKSSG